jgi:hypothetical protein
MLRSHGIDRLEYSEVVAKKAAATFRHLSPHQLVTGRDADHRPSLLLQGLREAPKLIWQA